MEGRYLEADDRLAAYVGTGLAERLGLKLGSRFVLTAQSTDGEIEGQLVRVVGVFRSGLPEVDEGLVHIPITTARAWLGAEGAATTVGAILPGSRVVPDAIQALEEGLDGGGIRVVSWTEAYPQLNSAVRIDDYGDFVFHGILFAIIALAVLNTILMSVLYRRREFGVLQALGLTPRETGVVIFLEGVLLTALAGVVGMIAGFALTWIFFRDGLDFSFLMDNDFTFSGIVMDPVIVPEFRGRSDPPERRVHRRGRNHGLHLSRHPGHQNRRGGGSEIRMTNENPSLATEVAVRTEDLWKVYPQEPEEVEAVRGVTLEIHEGDFMAMAGPSGSGKTTLLNMLGGLTRPTRGRIWVGEQEITEFSDKELAQLRLESIGFVFQAFNLHPRAVGSGERGVLAPAAGECPPRSATGACGSSSRRSASRAWRTESPESSPVASNSGWRLPGPWWACPHSSSRTSQRPISTPIPATRFWTSWRGLTGSNTPRFSSRPTTPA